MKFTKNWLVIYAAIVLFIACPIIFLFSLFASRFFIIYDDIPNCDWYHPAALNILTIVDVYHMDNRKYVTADGDDKLTMSKVLCEGSSLCNLDNIIGSPYVDYYYKGSDQYYYMILKTHHSYQNKHSVVKIDPYGIYCRDYFLDISAKAKSVNPDDITQVIYPRNDNRKKNFYDKLIDFIFGLLIK